MTDNQKEMVLALRRNGMGYGTIAGEVGISVNTVKSYCRRHYEGGCSNQSKMEEHICQQCGAPVAQTQGQKKKKFCSDNCRNKWWNSHTSLMKANAICAHCEKPFHGRKGRKYCSHACYIAERFGERHAS